MVCIGVVESAGSPIGNHHSEEALEIGCVQMTRIPIRWSLSCSV